jgi:hypothetical protein
VSSLTFFQLLLLALTVNLAAPATFFFHRLTATAVSFAYASIDSLRSPSKPVFTQRLSSTLRTKLFLTMEQVYMYSVLRFACGVRLNLANLINSSLSAVALKLKPFNT